MVGIVFRYAILVFSQPADFLAPADLSRANTGGGIFVIEDYIRVSFCDMSAGTAKEAEMDLAP